MKANPQQQKLYKATVINAMHVMYQPDQVQRLEAALKTGDPAEVIASQVATLMKGLKDIAGRQKIDLSMPFIIPAAKEVIGHVVEMLVQFKDIPQQQAVQVMKSSFDLFKQIVSGGQQQKQMPQPQQKPQQGGLLMQGA